MSSVVPIREDDDLIGVSADGGILLPDDITHVDAICVSVTTMYFRMFKRTKMVFTFVVIEGQRVDAGTRLQMFVRFEKWRTVPASAKLFKVACVALGKRLQGERITKSLFLKKAFRCRLAKIGDGAAAYSIIEIITEKLTG